MVMIVNVDDGTHTLFAGALPSQTKPGALNTINEKLLTMAGTLTIQRPLNLKQPSLRKPAYNPNTQPIF